MPVPDFFCNDYAEPDREVDRLRILPSYDYDAAPDDATPPAVSNFNPTSASTIVAASSVAFDVTDLGSHLIQIVTAVHSDGTAEIVWDGAFRGRFATSTRGSITNGFRFSVVRTGGWPAAGLTIRVIAIDEGGNTATTTASYAVSNPSNANDAEPPTVGDFDPPPGTELELDAPWSFTVTDTSGAFAGIFISVKFPTGEVETAFQGAAFQGRYAAGSSRVAVEGGWRCTLRRAGGWPARPTFLVDAIDSKGNYV